MKQLKSELAALDRKITAALAPKHKEDDGVENKQQPDTQRTEIRDEHSKTNDSQKSMVAEPNELYVRATNREPLNKGSFNYANSNGYRGFAPKM